MKILAIRGENLASLTGPFAIELDQEPLRDAGLFAITGQTGSGKSTLLDAICVALYDATPRLFERGGPAVGRDPKAKNRLNANDVRGLVSRGKAAGFAEVDFIGIDGQRYRARWEARKARNKVSGKFQKVERALQGLDDGSVWTGKKTEVQAAIQDRVGLTFEQFRRSALLAQGDFAAFLKAGEDQRAELLERMTGTEIYSRVSIAAYDRAKLEKRALDELAVQVQRLGVMRPETRDQAQKNHDAALQQKSASDAELAVAKSNQLWWTTDHLLAAEVASGDAAVRCAALNVQQAEPRRHRLTRVERAEPLRPTLHAVLDAKRRHQAAVEAELALDAKLALALAAKEAATANAAEAQSVALKARAAEEQAQDGLRAADRLDEQAQRLDAEIAKADQALGTLRTEAQAAKDALGKTTARVSHLTAAAAAATQWLDANPAMGQVAANWDRIERDLERLNDLENRLPLRKTAVEEGTVTVEQLGADVTAAEASHGDALANLSACEATYASLDAAIAPMAKTMASAREERDREQAHQSQAALDLAKRAHEWVALAAATTAAIEKETAHMADLSARAQALSQSTQHTQIRLEEARAAEFRATSSASLEQHRAQLQPDQPCGLCGSTHHPYVTGDAAPPGLAEQQARVQTLEAELDTHRTNAVSLASLRSTTLATLGQAQDTTAKCREKLDSINEPWAEFHALRSALPSSIVDPTCIEVAQAWTADADAQVAASAAHMKSLLAQEEARDDARRKRDAATKLEQEARRDFDTLKARHQALEKEHARHTQALKALLENEAQIRNDLASALADHPEWPEPLSHTPENGASTLRAQVRTQAHHQAALVEATAELRPLELAHVQQAAQLEQITATLAASQSAQQDRATQRAAWSEQRAALFAGAPTNQVRKEFRDAVDAAERAHKDAQDRERKAAELHSALGGQKLAARTTTRQAVVAVEQAEESLHTELQKTGFEHAMLEDLLSHDAAWIAQERGALQGLADAVQTATAVFQERTTKLNAHRESSPPTTEAQAQAALDATVAAHSAATDALATAAAELRRDDQARAQAKDKQREIDAQNTVYKRWAGLSEVIGAASGKKLRNFAQGLTLDVLLAHANHHLHALAPRYRLDRIPDAQLELQMIDTDMGDEVRAVNSLSGGETFLTSLALALGLSSLSADHTPVESLFIDEGFGTLDAETLELAFDALNTLQASGRQVGIISHVEALVDRVAVQVKVERLGAGQSRVMVATAR
ncbi:MAG: AAA family ATPase [Myxococcota bacterium]